MRIHNIIAFLFIPAVVFAQTKPINNLVFQINGVPVSGLIGAANSTGAAFVPTIGSSLSYNVSTGTLDAIQPITTGSSPSWVKVTSTATTGTPPFVVSSTTNVANLNASTLNGQTFTSPTITTPAISGAISFPAGTRQTFAPNGTTPGLNVGSYAGDPSTPGNGDLWYNSSSNSLRAQINGAAVSLGSGGGSAPPGGYTYRNKLINGDMRIDQRNVGTSLSLSSAFLYSVDRWKIVMNNSTGSIAQQSSTAPAGFSNSLKITIGTGASPAAGDFNVLRQTLEGYNVAEWSFGNASPASITLSFWVQSSITGTFSVGFENGAGNRTYIGQYTISSTNTWTQETVTLTGDSSGTWQTGNGPGCFLNFDLGSGSSFEVTPNTWTSANALRASGNAILVATSSATFYITGVQLETGSTATAFERPSWAAMIALCQRYFQKSFSYATKPAQASGISGMAVGMAGRASTSSEFIYIKYSAPMRTAPTLTTYNPTNANSQIWDASIPADCFSTGPYAPGDSGATIGTTGNSSTGVGDLLGVHWTADADF